MAKLLSPARLWIRAGLGLAVAAWLLPAPQTPAQRVFPHDIFASRKKQPQPQKQPLRATLQPSLTIAAEPFGFSPPNANYLGYRYTFVSLDFLDENRLLFTFHVPGLIHRNVRSEETEDERKIRALVIRLPDGAVEAETVWTLHDHDRYLYMLGNGQFLLRDGHALQLGDASLQLKPYLQFPGPVLWVETDPSGHYLVTGSDEPGAHASSRGDVSSPATAQASVISDDLNTPARPDTVLRILRRSDGKVMLVSHVRSVVHVPINGEGYLEALRANGSAWTLNFNYFTGGNTLVGSVDSDCAPQLDFISARAFLATGCTSSGDPKLVAEGLNGRRLWENPSVGPSIWPLLVFNADGTRVARETLLSSHSVNARAGLEADDIHGQDVQILDGATGKLKLRAAASPAFDAGGNVAISPSGRRAAIMMDGDLQIFDLPAPPPLPDLSEKK
jgi:hypothetical protein